MTRYVALLRGINVGKNPLSMERLRELCVELGFQSVRTYVQSGNVLFDARGSASKLSKELERQLAGEVRLPVTVILRTIAELETVLACNPFLKDKAIDRSKLHVTFLASAATKDASAKLASIEAGPDRYHIAGKEVFLYCPEGYGRTKLSNNAIEKRLSVRATTRNWNTVSKLCAMAREGPV